MRLNQYISSSGFCSRRRADRYIRNEQVTVNDEVITSYYMVNEGDRVKVDGIPIYAKDNDIYIMLNKPIGVTCTAASHIKDNIIEFMDYPERIFPVGRLDKQSEGLILLTDDGSIVNALLKEEHHEEKDYIVTVDKPITEEFITNLANGVNIYNPRKKSYTMTNQCVVIQLDDHRFKITLSQGLNRQIRRMCRYFQYTVTKLQRVRIKNVELGALDVGEWRYLSDEEVQGLKNKV